MNNLELTDVSKYILDEINNSIEMKLTMKLKKKKI